MTNDTTTLNGALAELGETLADNLITMGVTDASPSDGLTTLAGKILLVPQGGSTITVSLTADKSVLSYYHNESTTLSATVLENGSPKESATVEFFKGSTSLGTATTNSSGVATKSYASTGSGDVSFTAECSSIVSEIYVVEDCIYYNTNEVSQTTKQHSTIYDSNLSTSLPSKCEVSFDFYSNVSSSGYEHRFFLLPYSQFSTGTTQPQYALYVDQKGSNKGTIGKRENNSTNAFVSDFALTGSTYHTMKFEIDNTTIKYYVDGVLKTTQTISWIGNYTDYSISMIVWSSTATSKMKNVKIKAL